MDNFGRYMEEFFNEHGLVCVDEEVAKSIGRYATDEQGFYYVSKKELERVS